MKIGPQSKSDNSFTRKYRKLQSEYRANVLAAPYGTGPNINSKTEYGNMLVDGDKTGLNFISDTAFKYAKQKALDRQVIKDMTIDEFRLFNNMLSSMPMCFNLFADLRVMLLDDQAEVSRVIKAMFQEINWISNVTYIDVEFIPIPISDYTDDKSAFDAMIITEDEEGKRGIISIETKYTDVLGTNTSSKSSLKNDIIKNKRIFDQELVTYLIDNGYQQIHRNYLLTFVYAKKNKFKHFANVVVSPEEDKISIREIEDLQSHLLQNNDTVMKIALEEVVERAIESKSARISGIMQKFKERYITAP